MVSVGGQCLRDPESRPHPNSPATSAIRTRPQESYSLRWKKAPLSLVGEGFGVRGLR